MKSNNVETAKEVKQSESRIKLAEERNDPDQVIINISPDIFEKLQNEFLDMQEQGYKGSYNDFLRSKIRVTKRNGGMISNYKVELRKP
jgi:c-di-GMP-related signal transduction protein